MSLHDKATANIYQEVFVVTNVNKSRDWVQSNFAVTNSSIDPTEKKLIFKGHLKAVDPLSVSVILCNIDINARTVEENVLILRHVIQDIIPCHEQPQCEIALVEEIIERDRLSKLADHPYFTRPKTTRTVTDEELKGAQRSIMAWFQRHRIPVELDEARQELIVAECVRIKPPYDHESDYICPTRVILMRIKHMVDSRPS